MEGQGSLELLRSPIVEGTSLVYNLEVAPKGNMLTWDAGRHGFLGGGGGFKEGRFWFEESQGGDMNCMWWCLGKGGLGGREGWRPVVPMGPAATTKTEGEGDPIIAKRVLVALLNQTSALVNRGPNCTFRVKIRDRSFTM